MRDLSFKEYPRCKKRRGFLSYSCSSLSAVSAAAVGGTVTQLLTGNDRATVKAHPSDSCQASFLQESLLSGGGS